jgi:hypothetical protein
VVDLDGDGDPDVLSGSSDDKVAWYENTGAGSFSALQLISALTNNPNSMFAADLDGDGDPDVLVSSFDDDEVAWYEQINLADPLDSDSDDDGLSDGDEVNVHLTEPLDTDSDDDGLSDGDEVNVHLTEPLDADSDDDGLNDGDELNVYLTEPLDDDSDDDGLNDGDEVALGTSPNAPDDDGDGVCDGGGTGGGACSAGPDNCPFIDNLGQANSDALPAGDDCQCGDVNNDFTVDGVDVQIARENLVGSTLSGSFHPERCNVAGTSECGVDDIFAIERVVQGAPFDLQYICDAYLGP